MGTVGDSYDNAMAESFWASLKRELVDWSRFATHAEARAAEFEWINWYNNERLHTSLPSPHEFEQTSPAICSWYDPCPLRRGMFILPGRAGASRRLAIPGMWRYRWVKSKVRGRSVSRVRPMTPSWDGTPAPWRRSSPTRLV